MPGLTTDTDLESAVMLEPVLTPEQYIASEPKLNRVSYQVCDLATSSIPEEMLLEC